MEAIDAGVLIERESSKDKEFHFQNWFMSRLVETALNFDQGGRNSYPDFRLVQFTEGYELKGLAYPGREATFDSNSQVPTGLHNGRSIYYVFGRYPKHPDGDTYPVLARIDHRFGNEGDFGRPERFSESFAIDPVQVE